MSGRRQKPEDSAPVRVVLDVADPAALLALAEALGEAAADLWVDGKIDVDADVPFVATLGTHGCEEEAS